MSLLVAAAPAPLDLFVGRARHLRLLLLRRCLHLL